MPDPEPTILDESVLEELLATTGDDRAFVEELVHTYLSDAPVLLQAVTDAVEADDAAGLVRPAHTLKSSSATVGVVRLAALARELEMAARSGALDGTTRERLDEVQAAWRDASERLANWLGEEKRA